MTSDENTTLSADQESRLHILRQISEMTTSTAGIGSKTRIPVASLLTLADWVMSGEPTFHHLPSGFDQVVADMQMQAKAAHTEEIIVHSVAEDGLPDMSTLKGQVAFIYEGCVITGYPGESNPSLGQAWVVPDTVIGLAGNTQFYGIDYWIEFPVSIWELTR